MRDELFDQLLNSVNQQFAQSKSESGPTLIEWVESAGLILDGHPFNFGRHEYLREPYCDTHPYQVYMKGAQMGLTTLALLRTFHSARYRGFKGILYLFPNLNDVLDFSKARVAPLIDENPDTIGKWIRDTDAAGIKQIWNCFIYMRGMNSRSGLKSIPVDFSIYDELDEAPQNSVDLAMERMSHSEFREVLMLSNPTLPDYGIDKAFQETDQRYYLLKCGKCGEYTCLEDTFQDCLIELKDKVIRVCSKCKAELNPAVGEWVARRPSVIDKRGYHYSQLFSQYVDPGEIFRQFRTTNNRQDFFNLKIGVPYVEAENRLSVQQILALCGSDGIAGQDPGPCFMGVDQGKDLNVVIGKKQSQKAGKIVHLGIYRDWEELDRLMMNFNVARCVVDGQPETRNARVFAEKFKGKVFLNFYREFFKGNYKWDEGNMTVVCNRTESLDASHNEILSAQIILPREGEIVREFAKHLANVAKKLEEDEETGSRRYVYIKLGPFHFRHAYNYEAMARQAFPDPGSFQFWFV